MRTYFGDDCVNGKVLLIVHDVYQRDNEFSLGVGYLASVLQQAGVYVKVLCGDVYHYTNEEIGQAIRTTDFDIIGLGFLSARFKETVLPLCKEINKWKKDAWLVLGGHGASALPEYMLKKTGADVVVIGEGEETIVDLVDYKVNHGSLAGVKGVAYRDGDEVYVNEKRQPIKNLDEIPFPAWDLFPMEEYTSCMMYAGQDKNEKSFQIISGRDCPFECSFCWRMNRGMRLRSWENVIEEMKILRDKYGVSYFEFQDELFLIKKDRLFEFRNLLDEENFKIKFYCQARVDIFDDEMAKCLKEMGCKKLNIGFESMNQKVLDAMNKHTTPEQNIQTAELCHKFDLNMGLNFIWANPFDTEETLQEDVDFIIKYNTHSEVRSIRPVTSYPCCQLYYEAIQKGLLSGAEDFFNKFKNSDLITVNFTEIPTDKCHKLLFEANRKLIIDHFQHTNGDMKKGKEMIDSFYNLYFKGEHKFRGARHSTREVDVS